MIEIVLICATLYFIVMCFLIYNSRSNSILKYAALPVFVFTGAITYDHYSKSLGAPIVGYPEYEFVYIHHIIQNDTIILWTKNDNGSEDRLYVFPYNRETAKKLNQTQKATGSGKMMTGEFISNQNMAPGLEVDRWDGPADTFEK